MHDNKVLADGTSVAQPIYMRQQYIQEASFEKVEKCPICFVHRWEKRERTPTRNSGGGEEGGVLAACSLTQLSFVCSVSSKEF